MLAATARTVGILDVDAITSAPLRVVKTARLNAPSTAVFDVIADHVGLSSWFSLIEQVQVDHSRADVEGGDGTVRYCTLQGGVVLKETIVGFDPPRMYGYTIANGNAFGLERHLAVVRLEAEDTGTTVLAWHQYFDHPAAEAFVQQVNTMLDMGVQALIERFGGEALETSFPAAV